MTSSREWTVVVSGVFNYFSGAYEGQEVQD